jgi:serine/threonine-protein kinase
MSTAEARPPEDDFASLLAACDDALAVGIPAADACPFSVAAELRPRLERDLACLQCLQQLRPRRSLALPLTADQAGPAAGSSPELSFTRLGRFEIRRELGRGGFGVVYLAHDPRLGREVALKVPRAEVLATPELRQRFANEARAAASLDHPNVVPVYEAGEEGEVCYLASAYCPGPTLAAWHRERTEPVPWRTAAELVATVAAAVEHAHERGIVHRDLKPANVLLVRSKVQEPNLKGGSNPKDQKPGAESPWSLTLEPSLGVEPWDLVLPKVTDFGLAKFMGADEGQTQSGAVLGTPCYMAPEQAAGRNKAVGPAADVWALGVMLYELLTGRPPFQGETALDTLRQVVQDEPVPPARLRPRLPRDLETICLKCLRKEPRERYPQAAELARDLRRFLAGEPIRARPVGPAGRLGRWCRRKPLVAGLLAALLLALGGGAAGVAWQWRQAVKQREEAERGWAEADRQREAVQRERDEAEKSFRRALRAVDDSFTQVSESHLFDEPGSQPLRKKLLEGALRYYLDFLDQRGDDPALRAEVARAYFRVGLIRDESGSPADALAAYQKAREMQDQLIRATPADVQLLSESAKTANNMGNNHRSAARWTEALHCYRQARDVQESLVCACPTVARFQKGLALTCHNLGLLHYETGRPAEALHCYQQARSLQEQLVRADPQSAASYQHDLAWTCIKLGGLANEARRREEALGHYRRASEIGEQLVRDAPAVPAYQHVLAAGYHGLGYAHWGAGEAAEALRWYQQAHAVSERLARANPAAAAEQATLAGCCSELGDLQRTLGKPAEALPFLEQARNLYEQLLRADPENHLYRHYLGAALHNLGCALMQLDRRPEAMTAFQRAIDHQRAVFARAPHLPACRQFLGLHYSVLAMCYRDADRLPEAAALTRQRQELWPDSPEQLYSVACEWARYVPLVGKGQAEPGAEGQVQRRRYADEAMAALRQAVAKGYKQVEHIKNNPDLVPLRPRPDFQALLAEIETKAKPGVR